RDPRTHAGDARRDRWPGLHREPRARHPAGHPGGTRTHVHRHRAGLGFACRARRGAGSRGRAVTAAPARIGSANREEMARWTSELHNAVTAMFERLDGKPFEEAAWERKGGGGGQARLLAEGNVFEKAGVNRALVEGILPAEAAARLGGNIPT